MAGVANQDTPHKDRTVAGTGPHTAGARSIRKPVLQEFRQRLVQEMTHRSVPLPLDAFLDRFFPLPPNQRPKRSTATLRNKLSALDDAGIGGWKEDAIADTFTTIVNDHKLAPGLRLALSQDRFDANDPSHQKIDGAFFPHAVAPTDGEPHWAEQIVPVEFKRGETKYDPFEDNVKKALDPDAQSRKNVRSQIIGYAETIFEQRPRTHLFMLFVIGRNFRVMRWDRSGVVVTPLTDYVLEPERLHQVLWRLGRASKAQLGLDPTATLVKPGSAHYKLMDKLGKKVATDLVAQRDIAVAKGSENNMFAYVREMFSESLVKGWPRWKLSVPQSDGTMRYFLVGKPTVTAQGLVGRATQGYVAVDLLAKERKKQLVWLKDAWRTFYELVEAEGVVLEQLKREGVPFIPTVVCHGDLPGQATVTPDVWDDNRKAAEKLQECAAGKKQEPAARTPRVRPDQIHRASATAPPSSSAEAVIPAGPSSGLKRPREEDDQEEIPPPPRGVEGSDVDSVEDKCPLRRHIHYRIVVEEVALKLEQFEDGHHLVSVIYDCVKAHQRAAKLGILHRDISGGNILIYPKVVDDPKAKGKVVDDSESKDKVVAMRGLLTDWELSKDVKVVPGRRRRARQPERTGTWQYMSVALINEPTKAVEIPDELEAFFNVLLYYAVRYVRSDCKDVPHYIEFYFEAFQIVQGRYQCGNLKNLTISSGNLYTSEGAHSTLRFGTALDYILQSILRWLTAHHAVRHHARPQEGGNSSKPIGKVGSRRRAMSVDDDYSVDMDDESASMKKAPLSEETLKNAKKVQQHDHMLALLLWCINNDPRAKMPEDMEWPTDDKVPDRYPNSTEKQLPVAPTHLVVQDNDSNKRLKSNSGSAVLVQHPSRAPLKSYHSSISVVDSGFASGSRPAAGSCPP
ncbi:hypothetical protein C8Q70DRAFT_910159 [Cubamyces menziesii]|nr:hypothetical protein C8Q70DRAFT_910159 [Cubamyces menziesii]